jgi:hypothetical protein
VKLSFLAATEIATQIYQGSGVRNPDSDVGSFGHGRGRDQEWPG